MTAEFYYRHVETRSGKAWTPHRWREKPMCLRKLHMAHRRTIRVAGMILMLRWATVSA